MLNMARLGPAAAFAMPSDMGSSTQVQLATPSESPEICTTTGSPSAISSCVKSIFRLKFAIDRFKKGEFEVTSNKLPERNPLKAPVLGLLCQNLLCMFPVVGFCLRHSSNTGALDCVAGSRTPSHAPI